MNEWLQKVRSQIAAVWGKWKPVQKITFIGIVAGGIVGIVLLFVFSSAPTMVPVLTRSVGDDALLDRIATRLDQEGIEYQIGPDNRVMVLDQRIAQRARAILTREDLLPAETDPWELFDIDRWTQTDFERNVNLRRSITRQLEQHIAAIDDVDSASVTLVLPERTLFADDQYPVTASIILTPKPGSDIRENRRKIEGIEKLIQFAVEGLRKENITVTDRTGVVLNDFMNLAEFDRLELTRRELQIQRDLEREKIRAITTALGGVFGADRVRVFNFNVDLDMGKRTEETKEHFPIVTRPNNPRTPFDDSEFVLSIPLSVESVEERYEGTGFNPQGPPGQEGQTPPAYRDLDGVVGNWSNIQSRVNNEVNTRMVVEEKSPSVRRISGSVAIDGVWRRVYNERGELEMNPDGSIVREYVPITAEDLAIAQSLVENAVGYNRDRGDAVSVRHLQFDRSGQHNVEDDLYRRRRQIQLIVLYALIGVAVLLVSFIAFRLIAREIERRRRLREEELARQHQAMREAALRSAEEEGSEVEMSVEDRARMELQENAINLARERPEDVAQLIRTWLREE